MGWSLGEVNGKPVGYSVPDVCNHPECDVAIDRGLSYACGDMPGGGQGCDGFFCSKHLVMTGLSLPRQLCAACMKDLRKQLDDEGCNCDPFEQTGGGHAGDCPCFEPECTCYEHHGGHMPGCPYGAMLRAKEAT